MSKGSNKNRALKVRYEWQGRRCVPRITLSGNWLRELGFEVGQPVDVQVKRNHLTIKSK